VAIYDLFVSYSSRDRAWAEKLYHDIRVSFPQLRIFYDRDSIPAGAGWRQALLNAIGNSKHLLFFWSKNADTPNAAGVKEVDPEIERFLAHRDLTPQLEGSDRTIFYVPLEGARGGGVADSQGFPAFQAFYSPQAADLGTSSLASGDGLREWNRMIVKVGDAVADSSKDEKVIAGVVATNVDLLQVIDLRHDKRKKPDGPTLDQFLACFGLTWADVRTRYGRDALDWCPRDEDTIVTLLEDIRVRVNAGLDPDDRFQWTYVDLTDPANYRKNVRRVYEQPSVVVIDPVSLFDDYCAGVLRDLEDYVVKEESVIVSLSPSVLSADDVQAMYFKSVVGILDDYLQPKIPPGAIFAARCALDVRRTSQIDPLIRNRLRYPHVLARVKAARETAKESTGQR
jgi:hypothetical protein